MTALAEAVPLRRGACPGLSAPMATGDGLLVRLQPIGTLPLAAFAALCTAARRHGNGVIEITSRGNIQIRGLSVESAPRFAADIATLDIAAADGVPVLCNPLAGLDPDERVEAAMLAGELRGALARRAIAARLGAKTSIAIESGGALDPADVPADIRLSATAPGAETTFDIAVGGDSAGATPLGVVARRHAIEAVIALLEVLTKFGRDGRARDIVSAHGAAPFRAALADLVLSAGPGESDPGLNSWRRARQRDVIGTHALRDGSLASGVGLAFGHSPAATLESLVGAAADADASGFRAAPGRALLAIGLPPSKLSTFTTAVEELGFVTRAGDPRGRVIACAGAPICGSAYIAARALAPSIASRVEFTVHISGCVKGCAQAKPAVLTVVGAAAGCALVANGTARDAPFATVSVAELPAAIAAFAKAHEDNHV